MCQTNENIENGTPGEIIVQKMPANNLTRKKNGIFLDEAFTKTKFGLFNYVVILTGGIVLIAVLLETCGICFVIPVSQCDLSLTAFEKGVLSSISFFGIICSSHLWGYLADTAGRRRVIMPSLFFAFLLSCGSSLCQNFYLLVAFRFLNGFFISGPAAAIYAYLSEFHNDVQRGRAIMSSSTIYGVSCLLAPLLAWSVINQDWQFDIPYIGITYKPWRLFLVVASLPSLLGFVILLFLPESPKFVLGQGKKEETHDILRRMNRINNGRNAELEDFDIYEEPESIENRKRLMESKESRFPLLTTIWVQTAPLFKPPYLFSTMLICAIQFGTYATSNGFYMFFAEILNKMASNLNDFTSPRIAMCDVINMNPVNLTAVNLNDTINEMCITKLEMETLEQGIILEILYAVGFVLISLIINRVGKFPILFVVLAVSGAGGISCMLVNIPLLQIYSFIALMCCGMAVNVTNAATVELYPTAARGMAVSIAQLFGRLGSILGAICAALLLDNQCHTVFYLSGSSLLVIAVLTFFIPNIHKKAKTTQNILPAQPRPSIVSLR